ncbi:MAG: hypothetical protein WCL04_08505 [Verrucomicrobiota bacterium]
MSVAFWKRLPFARLTAVVVLLLAAGEEFPFTRLPMYSTFDPVADYYYVADATGAPLACEKIFGTSTANVKKMFRARLNTFVAPRGADEKTATVDERRRAGESLLAELRATGARRGAAVPAEPVRLHRVEVRRGATTDGFVQTDETIAAL